MEIDLEAGMLAVAASGIARSVTALPAEIQVLLAGGGLIPFLKAHPDWQLRDAGDE